MRVGLFIPCYVDQVFPQVGIATAWLLRRAGIEELVFPPKQACCGQPAFNTGYWFEARRVAASWLDAFIEVEPLDAIVVPSGSCGAMVKVFFPELWHPSRECEWTRHERELAPAAHRLAAKVHELSQFLVDVLGIEDLGASCPMRITYHDSCHHTRELDGRRAPRRLLKHVAGLELVEMQESDTCCGFGGTFAVKFEEISSAMAQQKVERIRASGAEAVVSADVSCLMHLQGWMKRHHVPVRVMHLAEVLACGAPELAGAPAKEARP